MPISLSRLALLLLLLGLPACSGEEPADGATEVDLDADGFAAEEWTPEG